MEKTNTTKINEKQMNPLLIERLDEIFDELRRGRHISAEDGPLYWIIRDNFDCLKLLFEKLGFKLEAHQRDFYYFHGTGNLSDRSERMAVFMFILIEWLSDQGHQVEEALMTKHFKISELPHFHLERYAEYMKEAGLTGQDSLGEVLKNLERYGFAERMGADVFRFKAPVFRFVDLCHIVLQENSSNKLQSPKPHALPNDSVTVDIDSGEDQ